MIMETLHAIKDFAGNGIYIIIAAICFIIMMTDKRIRRLYGWPVLILIIGIANPFSVHLLSSTVLDGERINKLFMVIPILLIIGAGITLISKKNVIAIIALALLVLLGSPVQVLNGDSVNRFAVSTNKYKLLNGADEVADKLIEAAMLLEIPEESTIKAAVDPSLTTEIRQYNARINLEFGRRPRKSAESRKGKKVAALFEESVMNTHKLAFLCKKDNCDFIVLKADTALSGDFYNGAYALAGEVAGYYIYARTF